MAKGIDVSEWQTNIEWGKVRPQVDFVLIRSGLGYSREDEWFIANVNGAKSVGLPIVGTYHFSYALNPQDAIIEAEFAIKEFEKAGLDKNTAVIFYDYEYESIDYAKQHGITPNAGDIIDLTRTFCDVLKSKGYKYGVYCNNDFYNNYYNKGKGIPEGAVLWYADYRKNPTKSIVDKALYWQNSSTGKIDGINGNVDTNISNSEVVTSKSEEKPVEPLNEVEILKLAEEVIAGKYGNGETRKKNLGANYTVVQNKVNELLAETQKPEDITKKEVTPEIVSDVISGKYGNGDDRKNRLESIGYNYREVQDAVNKALTKNKSVSPAKSFDNYLTGQYKVTATALNLRYIPGLLTDNNVVKVLKNGETVQCWGYYTDIYGKKWYLVQLGSITGYVDSTYLAKL